MSQSTPLPLFDRGPHPFLKSGPDHGAQPKTDFICHAYNGISVLCGADHKNWSQVHNTLVNIATDPSLAKWVKCPKCRELLDEKKPENPPAT